jgi:predicted nuclease with TOPRIM domain
LTNVYPNNNNNNNNKNKNNNNNNNTVKSKPLELYELAGNNVPSKLKSNYTELFSLKERNSLLEELLRRREDYGEVSNDLQVIEAERVRLSLLEEKIKEVLTMLRSLNSMVIK